MKFWLTLGSSLKCFTKAVHLFFSCSKSAPLSLLLLCISTQVWSDWEGGKTHTQSIWLLKSQHLASYLKVTPTAQHILSSAPVTIKTSSETKSGIKLTTVVNFCCRSLDESNFLKHITQVLLWGTNLKLSLGSSQHEREITNVSWLLKTRPRKQHTHLKTHISFLLVPPPPSSSSQKLRKGSRC